MDMRLKVLHVDASSGFYRIERHQVGHFFGPIDLGLHLAGRYNSLNIGTGLLCGSIFPGSNRLFFTGFSPCWGNFFISSMGGAGLVFDNLGINMLSIRNCAARPSILYLNRVHGEEIEVELHPVDPQALWRSGRGGVYAVTDWALENLGDRYLTDPRVLATGPAAAATDFGAVMSVPVTNKSATYVDTWAGRGGFGTKMFQQHGIVGVIYGGTFVDEDFRDRSVANEWFETRYNKKMAAKDLEATTKYRLDPALNTGGTFGVNYAKMGGRLLAFNYRSLLMDEEARSGMWQRLVSDHYLRQFNEDLHAVPKGEAMRNCGEPCAAVCKKMHGTFKKDYEPYQTMGPLTGIFDQRAAELLNHHADTLGFDAISVGGVLSWIMECLDNGSLSPAELGVSRRPVFSPVDFAVTTDSMHNAELGVELLDRIIAHDKLLDLREGARKLARELARTRGKAIMDSFVFNANARKGWMVPNQYWTPGVLAPMPIMGKYYMYYGNDFFPPRELGHRNAERMMKEILLDNAGFCRFHRLWAEDMVPDIIHSLFGVGPEMVANAFATSCRINSRNAAVYWESDRNITLIETSLVRMHEVDGNNDPALLDWIDAFKRDKDEAALSFWFEMRKGIHEVLRERFT